jgi:hypothetical protein
MPGRGTVDCAPPGGNGFVTGSGADEEAGWPEELNRWLRQAYVAAAEEESQERLGRGLTAEELDHVLRTYAGDVVGPREPEMA